MDGHVITEISRIYRSLFPLPMVLRCALLEREIFAIIPLRKKTRRFWKHPKTLYALRFFNEIRSYQHIPSHYFGNQEHNCIHKIRRCSHSFEKRGIRDSLQHIHRYLHNTNHIVRIRQTLATNPLTNLQL